MLGHHQLKLPQGLFPQRETICTIYSCSATCFRGETDANSAFGAHFKSSWKANRNHTPVTISNQIKVLISVKYNGYTRGKFSVLKRHQKVLIVKQWKISSILTFRYLHLCASFMISWAITFSLYKHVGIILRHKYYFSRMLRSSPSPELPCLKTTVCSILML